MQFDQPCFTVDLLRQRQRQQEGLQPEEAAAGADADDGGADEGSANVVLGGGGAGRRGRGGMGVPGSKERCLERLKVCVKSNRQNELCACVCVYVCDTYPPPPHTHTHLHANPSTHNPRQAAGWDWMVPLVAATPEPVIFERALYDRLPLDDWAAPGRRVVLLGDSAHGMHPGPGQGARSAFEVRVRVGGGGEGEGGGGGGGGVGGARKVGGTRRWEGRAGSAALLPTAVVRGSVRAFGLPGRHRPASCAGVRPGLVCGASAWHIKPHLTGTSPFT